MPSPVDLNAPSAAQEEHEVKAGDKAKKEDLQSSHVEPSEQRSQSSIQSLHDLSAESR